MSKFIYASIIAGIVGSFLIIGYLFLLWEIGQNPFGQYKYLYFGLYSFAFIGALYYARYRLGSGYLKAQHALLIGFLVNTITSCSFWILLIVVLPTPIGQSAKARHIVQSLQLLEDTKKYLEQRGESLVEFSPDNFEIAKEQITHLTDRQLASDQTIGIGMVGVVLSFVFMLFFKKTPQK